MVDNKNWMMIYPIYIKLNKRAIKKLDEIAQLEHCSRSRIIRVGIYDLIDRFKHTKSVKGED